MSSNLKSPQQQATLKNHDHHHSRRPSRCLCWQTLTPYPLLPAKWHHIVLLVVKSFPKPGSITRTTVRPEVLPYVIPWNTRHHHPRPSAKCCQFRFLEQFPFSIRHHERELLNMLCECVSQFQVFPEDFVVGDEAHFMSL